MIRVKFSSNANGFPFLRQTPGGKGRWMDFQFVYDEHMESCDWWVVYEGLKQREVVDCPPENTILVMAEPPSVKVYNPRFVAQFAHSITANPSLSGKKFIHNQPALPWLVGWDGEGPNPNRPSDYDAWKNLEFPEKTEALSVVISNKAFTRGHKRRIEFVRRLKEYFGNQLHLYGRGFNEMRDKWDAIAPYRFHLVLENSIYPDYWTEKLSDSFLGCAYPFYSGSPAILEYFHADAITPISVADPEESIKKIKRAMDKGLDLTNRDALLEARAKVLEEYNLFAVLKDTINRIGISRRPSRGGKNTQTVLHSEFELIGLGHRIRSRLHKFAHKLF
ncbi:MAG: glycosyltransferase family 10 [bacterium]|nr:glycosyltransferase family 10 [bacterium]